MARKRKVDSNATQGVMPAAGMKLAADVDEYNYKAIRCCHHISYDDWGRPICKLHKIPANRDRYGLHVCLKCYEEEGGYKPPVQEPTVPDEF